MLIADAVAMTQLKNDGRLLAYPEAPVEGLPEAVVDPDMTFFGTKLITTGIVYNTDLVDTPPTSWSELAAPDVASSLIMPSPLYSGSAVIHGQHHGPAARVRLGLIRDTGGERRRRWPRQRHHDRGRGAGREGLRHHHRIHGAQRAGRGIARGLRVPQEGVSSITQPVAILSDSDNVEAAKVFVDWQLGQAAQEQSVEQVYFPIREGVAQPEGYPDPASLTILSADLAVMLADHAANKQQFAGLLGG
jgi:iron(III) transport system substrate-binding protein